jgi:N-carbamoyl-L-amino-acid hydrolase
MISPVSPPVINAERLWDSILQSAAIGATPRGGLCRLSLTELDKQIRDWFRTQCEAAGCAVTVDSMGNVFGRRAGQDPKRAPIAMGSHLDTQPTGGRFDGILGVLAGLEVVRTLNDLKIDTFAPIEVIDWTNEEGSRFAPAMLASGVFAGVFTEDYANAREDRSGVRFDAELARIGYRGGEACGAHPLSAHFELHIEQGPVLEDERKTIGVVTGIQGMRWYEVTLRGTEAHAGTTPMHLRRDALLGASRLVDAVNRVALAHAPDARSTVGLIESKPNSRNTVPGAVFMTVDLRHPENAVVESMESDVRAHLTRIAAESGLGVEMRCVWNSPAIHFDTACIEAVRAAATAAGYPHRDIVSGAGHDSGYIARVAPAAMVFVPCATGLSHNEEESASLPDIAAGANVLLRAVLETDRRLAS